MLVLGLETSCDETAAAVVRGGRTVLSNAVYSQVARHAAFGGVVPEVAARAHLEPWPALVERAVAEAGVSWSDLDAVAATRGPGLATSLIMGFSAAKALALRLNRPLIGVHHLAAHLYSVLLGCHDDEALFPVLFLLASGGHTMLVRYEGPGRQSILGRTVDDAAGEALDKGAKLLGLGYPGGPLLEAAARTGNRDRHAFPRGVAPKASPLGFSFSGLKTALLYHVRSHPDAGDAAHLPDVSASYQEAVVDSLLLQMERAMEQTGPFRSVAAAGGVACNGRLRERLTGFAKAWDVPLLLAEPAFCTDNAAMIAGLAGALLAAGAGQTSSNADIDPNLPME